MANNCMIVGVDIADAAEITKRELLKVWRQKVNALASRADADLPDSTSVPWHLGETASEVRKRARAALVEVEAALNETNQKGVVFSATCHNCGGLAHLLMAGGVTHGDDPSGLFECLSYLWKLGVFSLTAVDKTVLEGCIADAQAGVVAAK